MGKQSERSFAEIEDTQAALRQSIAQAKELAEKSEGLLLKHKQHLESEIVAAQREAYRRENPL